MSKVHPKKAQGIITDLMKKHTVYANITNKFEKVDDSLIAEFKSVIKDHSVEGIEALRVKLETELKKTFDDACISISKHETRYVIWVKVKL